MNFLMRIFLKQLTIYIENCLIAVADRLLEERIDKCLTCKSIAVVTVTGNYRVKLSAGYRLGALYLLAQTSRSDSFRSQHQQCYFT